MTTTKIGKVIQIVATDGQEQWPSVFVLTDTGRIFRTYKDDSLDSAFGKKWLEIEPPYVGNVIKANNETHFE